jgi:hypothetical protein
MRTKNIISSVLSIIVIMTISGCASKTPYHADPITTIDQKYKFDLKMKKEIDPGFFVTDIKNIVTLYINDEIALQGNLDRYESGQLQGLYEGKKLNLECDKDTIFSPTRCIVHLDKTRIAELSLKIGR